MPDGTIEAMKKLTCKELGGACDDEITGETFQEMGENSRNHVMGLMEKGDTSHNEAMEKMKNMSQEELKATMNGFQKKFDEAEEA